MQTAPRKPHLSVGSPSGRTSVSVHLSPRAVWGTLTAVALLLAGFGAAWGAKKLWAKPPGAVGTNYELRPGPWGHITAQPILIEAPASLLSVNFRLGDGRWSFPARTPGEVAAILRDAGLTEGQTEAVLARLEKTEGRDGLLSAVPPADLVRSLATEVRSKLYDKLAATPENFAQVEPFRTTALHLDKWLDPQKLPPDLVATVKNLMWHRGSGLFFSDYNLVADQIASPAVKLELLRQLTRKSSVVLTLEVPAGEDVGDLVAYYGVNGRRDKVEPILKALGEAGGGSIGFSNMLPVFARGRLYRFPDALPGKDVSNDCHWATFNFFARGQPDDSLTDSARVAQLLGQKYEPVAGEPRFGDVVLLTLPEGSSIHSATYIADNIVFTKNGPSLAAPFIFSTIEDMLAFYANNKSIRLAYYRLKGT